MKENNLIKKNDIRYIIVHCSDTNNNDTAIDIHKLHISFGWDGIGYHKVICRSGKVENGRPEYWIGAHVKGKNNISLGGQPYYLHPLFDWRIKKLWQNDPNAVRYWIKNIKENKYPDDFETKTY